MLRVHLSCLVDCVSSLKLGNIQMYSLGQEGLTLSDRNLCPKLIPGWINRMILGIFIRVWCDNLKISQQWEMGFLSFPLQLVSKLDAVRTDFSVQNTLLSHYNSVCICRLLWKIPRRWIRAWDNLLGHTIPKTFCMWCTEKWFI